MNTYEHHLKVQTLVHDYHHRVCTGKLNGFFCNCATEVAHMMVFKELTDKWLS